MFKPLSNSASHSFQPSEMSAGDRKHRNSHSEYLLHRGKNYDFSCSNLPNSLAAVKDN